MAVATGIPTVGRSAQGANWLKETAMRGCRLTKLVRAVIMVQSACYLLSCKKHSCIKVFSFQQLESGLI